MKSHSENKGFPCKYCGKYFKPASVLHQHVAAMHGYIKATEEIVVGEDKVHTVEVAELL